MLQLRSGGLLSLGIIFLLSWYSQAQTTQWKNYVRVPGLTLVSGNPDPLPTAVIVDCPASVLRVTGTSVSANWRFTYTLPADAPSVNVLRYHCYIQKEGVIVTGTDHVGTDIYHGMTPKIYSVTVSFSDSAINETVPIDYTFHVELEANTSGTWHSDECVFSVQKIATYLKGDLDGTGVVEGVDALLLADWLAGNPVYLTCLPETYADLDASGTVSPADLVILLQYLAGNVPSLSTGNPISSGSVDKNVKTNLMNKHRDKTTKLSQTGGE